MYREEEEKQDPAVQQDKEEDAQGRFNLADLPADNTSKAFAWLHAGWRSHRNCLCALHPICDNRVRCAGNTTHLENDIRRNDGEEHDRQLAQKGAPGTRRSHFEATS